VQLVLTAEPIDAQRAWQCNLVMKVVPPDRLLDEAELVARQILRNSQRAVRSAKDLMRAHYVQYAQVVTDYERRRMFERG